MLTNPRYAKLFDFAPPTNFHVRACALNCGCYFIPAFRFLPPSRMGGFMEAFLPTDHIPVIPQLKTANYATRNFPPTVLMTSHHDYLRMMAKPLYYKLKRKRAECELHIYGSKEQTEIGHCFHLNCRSDIADRCNDDECAFFRAHMA